MIKDKIDINIITIILIYTCFVICNLTMLKLKPSFLFKQKRGGDMGFPSVCCEYHWLIKKLACPDRVDR